MNDYIYRKGSDSQLDEGFQQAQRFAKVRISPTHLFWKKGLRRYTLPLSDIVRAWRRVEAVSAKTCCATSDFDIQKLMVVTAAGEQLEILIGDALFHHEAERLFEAMQAAAPHINYTKL